MTWTAARDPEALVLRPFGEADVPFFAGMAADERVTRYVGDGRPWDEDRVAARVGAALEQAPLGRVGSARWFVAWESEEPVGLLVSSRQEPGVEIGYWVPPEHWGRGVAGAMVEQALALIRECYGPTRLVARVDPANAASARVLLRRGFVLQGLDDGLDRYVREG